MQNIVQIKDDNLLVSIRDIAKFSGVEYESTQRLVRKSKQEFKELGLSIPKESDFKSVLFDEYQASFLITLMKNTPIVKRFKLDLVKQFKTLNIERCDNNKSKLDLKEKQLKISQRETEEAKRKAYAHTRNGNYQCVTNILRDTRANISAEVFNKILLSKGYVSQKEVMVKKYIANEKESTASLDGTVLMHYDTAIEVLKEYDVEFTDDNQMKMEF